jgi:isoleucyl-tRNA synthetase
MEADYRTMDPTYMESVWWVFKTLFGKGLVYEGKKSMHICPRCETTLANFEVAQGYKDITDISVVAKFELEGEDKTYILAWTTTPWTLPGNVALAVNPDIDYVKAEHEGNYFIVAKERFAEIFKGKEHKFVNEFKGKDLIGRPYKPLFSYFSEKKDLENKENGWKIYGADFVSTDEGTGVVHIAPAFGENDMNLAREYNLPFVQHVLMDGRFNQEVRDFAGLYVKPKENPQATDIEIIRYLGHKGLLFAKQKITHSYPHCWRCDTPLLNYAASSWFVRVSQIKDKLIGNNKKINWVPAHIKEGRFGKWLLSARDWAVSRSRFWGAPLPVWKCGKCKEIKVIGSVDGIKENVKKSGNKYFVMRHGGAQQNEMNIVSSRVENSHHLTEKGRVNVAKKGDELKSKTEKIDFIFSSNFARTRETAEIMAEKLGIDKNKIIYDKRIREIDTGVFDGKNVEEYHSYFSSLKEKFAKTPPQGENLMELKNRMAEFLYDIDRKYSGKNVLIVSHEYPIWMLFAGAKGAGIDESVRMKEEKGDDFIKTSEIMELDFAPIPHNENFELDLHRPYIDEISFNCSCGGSMERIPDVFDCWFESGSMPYASAHYPFAFAQNQKLNLKNQNFGFPAEFIAEGLDQTRGWFYTLLVLSTGLFSKPAFKNVIVNGIILAEDGQKMSKRLKNYPDPMEVVSKYGADALRLYLLSSPVVRAENLNFSEKGVDEVYKKVILRLWNTYSFYEMYCPKGGTFDLPKVIPQKSDNVLDQWILARLDELKGEVLKWMERYELDKAVRPIAEFVDDLSTWYIRRSRERLKREGEDQVRAARTTKFVLVELSKIIAPFTPFMAERIYKLLKGGKESVHLESWPEVSKGFFAKIFKRKPEVVNDMKEVRKIVSFGLEARAKEGIKVRQPLAALKIKSQILNLKNNEELLKLIKDEVNVKEIIFDEAIKSEVELDTSITEELKKEGQLRELVRGLQDLRKKAGLNPGQKIVLEIQTDSIGRGLVLKFEDEFKKSVGALDVKFVNSLEQGESVKVDNLGFKIKIK